MEMHGSDEIYDAGEQGKAKKKKTEENIRESKRNKRETTCFTPKYSVSASKVSI
jgi:ribosomal protein S4